MQIPESCFEERSDNWKIFIFHVNKFQCALQMHSHSTRKKLI